MQPNQYFIHHSPSRTQQVQHFYSSLAAPTLQNIESQLQAQRIKNHQIGAAYFQQKYGNTRKYNEVILKTGYEPPVEEEPARVYQRQLYSVSGNKEYEEFLRGVLKEKQKEIEEAVRTEGGGKQKGRSNPWVEEEKREERKSGIKPQEIKYVSEFQKFRQNKKKPEPSPAPSLPSKKPRNYKRELLIKVFRELDAPSSTGYILKSKAITYLQNNLKIIQVCDLNESSLPSEIYIYETEDPEKMKIGEFLEFFGEYGNVENLRESVHYTKGKGNRECLLEGKEMRVFEEIFKGLDRHNDLIIKRRALVEGLRGDERVDRMMMEPVLREDGVGREVTLYRVLERVELEEEFAEGEEKKIKEYIYYNQFLKYFESQHRWDQQSRMLNKINLHQYITYLNRKNSENTITIDNVVTNIITEGLRGVKKEGSYFVFDDFRRYVQKEEGYKQAALAEVRVLNTDDGSEVETFEEILKRIGRNHTGYITVVEFLEYLGERGVPIDMKTPPAEQHEHQKKKIEEEKQTPSPKAKKQISFQQPKQIDGYDSDPEIYQSGVYHPIAIHNNLQDNFRGTFVSIVQDTNAFTKLRSQTHSKSQGKIIHPYEQQEEEVAYQPPEVFKITVPEPFSFQNRELLNKKRKFKQDANPFDTSNGFNGVASSSFKAKEIPREVLEIGLYDKINENNEKRREDIKKMSMLASLAVEKPFGFLTRETKARKKNVEERKEFVFKSKPVPWFCKPNVYKQKTDEQDRLRRERVEKMAYESLAKAKLPPRMQRHQKQQELKKQEEKKVRGKSSLHQTQFKAKTPPDFTKIHKDFGEKLEKNKQSKQTTVAIPFALTETKPVPQTLNQPIKQEPRKDPIQYARKLNSTEPKLKAASTLKYQNQVEKRRKDIEERKRKDEEKQRVQKSVFEEDVKIKLLRQKELQQLDKKVDKRKEEYKERARKQEEDYKVWKEEIIEKAKGQKLLYERPLKRDEQLERMKRLYAMYEIIKGNFDGVKEKDRNEIINNAFDKEERNLIKDYEFLLKNKKV